MDGMGLWGPGRVGLDEQRMPSTRELKASGKTWLKQQIVYMGGAKLLARKMGLLYKVG